MSDASGMYASPTGARPQNGGAGQGQGNNEGFNAAATATSYTAAPGYVADWTYYCADLGYDMSEPSIIYEDNKACISISEGDTDKKRTKHIASKHSHFVKEKRAALRAVPFPDTAPGQLT